RRAWAESASPCSRYVGGGPATRRRAPGCRSLRRDERASFEPPFAPPGLASGGWLVEDDCGAADGGRFVAREDGCEQLFRPHGHVLAGAKPHGEPGPTVERFGGERRDVGTEIVGPGLFLALLGPF